jgi:hypothetical protein
MRGHASPHRSHCQNCGAALSGPYCSQCGQHDVDYNRSFWHILEESLEGVFHFDGKFFRSSQYIFTRPGFLTNEFLVGRRTRYAHPLRVYFFASFLFFVVVALSRPPQVPDAVPAAGAPQAAPSQGPSTSVAVKVEREGVKGGKLEKIFTNPIQIQVGPGDEVSQKALNDEVSHLLPTLFFLCVPLLALVLKLVYIRSGRPYVEHLIFALHIQALAFLSFIAIKAGWALGFLVGGTGSNAIGLFLILVLVALVYRAFRAVYGQGRLMTALKLLLTGALYVMILIGGLVGLVTFSIGVVRRGA